MDASIQSTFDLKAPGVGARLSDFIQAALILFASNAAIFVAARMAELQRLGQALCAWHRPAAAPTPQQMARALTAARSLGYAALPVDAGGVVAMVMLQGHTRIVVLNARGRRLSKRELAYLQGQTDADALWFLDELTDDLTAAHPSTVRC